MSRESPFTLLEEVVAVQALAACADVGVLDSLFDGETSTEELARRHEVAPVALDVVLEVLKARGWVTRVGQTWRAGGELTAAERVLPEGVGNVMRSMAGIADFMRAGAPLSSMSAERYSKSVGRLGDLFEDAADELAERVACEPTEVLDLGTGSGVFGLAMGQRHQSQRVVGVDREPVLASFLERAASMGMSHVAVPHAADFLRAPLPTGFGCTMICNVLRVLQPEDAATLVRRAATTLDDDGCLVIVDVMGDDQEHALRRAIYRLHLALRSSSGGPHSDDAIESWLHAAGLDVADRFGLRDGAMAEQAIVARRS